ncbi:zinc protease [Roseivirga ehrenbergii]|uniref:Peptidase M16 n=1 Tax=Roseivirga ehrenbergii (strain DSM 102268 / JCM 13514 / KCTC 12282 / NCIMB 14502 / KMM 6017) TaxID=279360 RepID=A0A150X741_ROSEK|nr:pitrilysin family protein [Roseivirga ehrenbergii]KYG74559.1 peptidase M16 [Roseivirga ehrenbergii]TCL14126.1 zinc protease [Roseivirga ehrenbergii]
MKTLLKHRLVAFLSLVFVLSACTGGGEEKESAEFKLDYDKYTLDNGLEVVVHKDNSDPKVAVAVLYHVGSNREKPGRTGFAHFFEHMLFQNSENVGAGNFIKNVNDLGGTFNGGTWTDGTIYYETVPSDALEQMLWMESDRMGFFINTISDWGLENEKQVVKNEKRQGVDNRPYGHKEYVKLKNLYPEGHPYSWDVIGSLEDLQNATVADVKEFYNKWYGPNNATLVIAGDVDEAEVKTLVEKYFGEFEPRAEIEAIEPQPAVLDQTKLFYHEDKFANLPDLQMTWPTVEQYHPDYWALNMLGQVLTDGKKSALYKVIVEEKKLAPSVFAYNSSAEIAGTFSIGSRAFDGVNLNDLRAAIFEGLQRFESEGFSDADLARIKIGQETGFYNGMSSVFGKASSLAQYNTFAGDPGFIVEDLEKSQNVTREDIMRVYNKYVKDKNYLATSFVPVGQTHLVLEGSEKASVVEEAIVQGAEKNPYSQEVAFEKTPSKIDRSVAPPLKGTLSFDPPAINNDQLANGMKVFHIYQDELPMVQFSLRIKGGMFLDEPTKIGTAALLDNMLMEGTANKTALELQEAIGQLGARISVFASKEYITISGNSLAKNYDKVLDLVEEILFQPRWDEGEFDRVKKSALNSIQQSAANPNAIASNVFNKVLYGKDHIFAYPTSGTTETVSNITLDDLKDYYNKNFSPSLASFHFVGALDEPTVMASLKRFDKWEAKDVEFPEYEIKTADEGSRIYFVDYPDAKQSVINIGNISMNGDNEDFAAAEVANYRLGSGSGSILFKQLRLEKGYTYGAYSGFSRNMNGAPFTASSSVRSNVTRESVELFKEILDNYGENFSEEDMENTRTSILRSNTQSYETLGGLVGILQNISTYNLPMDYIKKDEERLKSMTSEDAKEIIGEYMNPDKLIYVVVGDGKTQLNLLNNTGLGKPIVVNPKDEKLELKKK